MSADRRQTPSTITLERGRALRVVWADDHESVLPLLLLREKCPCARCRTGRRQGAEEGWRGSIPADLEALEVVSVGAYALRIRWNDEHRSGIYPYPLLRSLCPCPTCRAEGA